MALFVLLAMLLNGMGMGRTEETDIEAYVEEQYAELEASLGEAGLFSYASEEVSAEPEPELDGLEPPVEELATFELDDAEEQVIVEPEGSEGPATHTATLDVTTLEAPYSLNALMRQAWPELDEAAVLSYYNDILSIEQSGDDSYITPLCPFASAEIVLEAGDIYVLRLIGETFEVSYPAQQFDARVDGLTVYVTADEGAFPDGTSMTVSAVNDASTLDGIASAVGDAGVRVRQVRAVDIAFHDVYGAEIEPLSPIAVTMDVDALSPGREAVIVHVDDAGNTEVMEQIVAEAALTGESERMVAFEAGAFSVYAVVITQRYISADGQRWNIQVSYGPDAGIPDGASLEVRELDGEAYFGCLQTAAVALDGRISAARFFDIAIVSDGMEIQPAAPVEVRIDMEQPEGDVQALHFGGAVEPVPAAREDGGVVFDARAFSVYGVVYTVDFDLDGLEYRLTGGEGVWLGEVLAALGLDGVVRDVMFSNPDVLSMERVGEDWRLLSLCPFDTCEALTVVFEDGRVVVIQVSDAQHVTDMTRVITDAELYLDDEKLDWSKPVLLREGKYYDLRLFFKENNTYQFVDTDEWMTYPLPEGIDMGLENFERTFTMTVDDTRLENNTLRYDATLRMFFIKWNTQDTLGFNKLKASNSAEFRIDLQVQFTFNPDKIDFGNDIVRDVIRDTNAAVAIEKTGVFDKDNDRVDYTVSVISYGNSENVVVRDALFGTALAYIDDGTAQHGVRWETNRPGGNPTIAADPNDDTAIRVDVEYYSNDDIAGENGANSAHAAAQPKGFSLVVGEMADGECIDFHYSARVDYEVLAAGSGSGDYDETFNRVEATANGTTVEADHHFTGDLRYVELKKSRTPVNWGSSETTTINWTVRVNERPKVGLANTPVRDRIYAGDLESMDYSGDGLHVQVYDANGVFVGEYDVPWEQVTRSGLAYSAEKESAIDRVADWSTAVQAEKLTEELRKPVEEQDATLIAVLQGDRTPYTYAQWEYIIPEKQAAVNGDTAVTIDNRQKYYYDITYTTLADKTLMNFDGYVGNEAREYKTDSMMQGGLYPPGEGTVPEVTKTAVYSNEDYIYWNISFNRQGYSMTRCVIEDNNPVLWGRREPVDVGEKGSDLYTLRTGDEAILGTDRFSDTDEPFEVLWVEGLSSEERWQVASASDTRTSFKFYQNPSKPGLLSRSARGDGAETITIHLRTRNNPEWIQGTMTRYWPRDHVNTVTWVANAHEVQAEAMATPDVRKIEKTGQQVGSVVDETGVSLPVFRYELYLTGISESDFYTYDEGGNSTGTKNLVIYDAFNTDYLAFVDVKGNATVSGAKTLTNGDKNELKVDRWDQGFKGYSKTNSWVGPTAVSVSDYRQDGRTVGVAFTITPEDFAQKGYEPGEPGVYCLRYSLPYYLMVKDAEAARRLASLSGEELSAEGITKENDQVTFGNTATWAGVSVPAEANAEANFKPLTKTLDYDVHTDTCTYTLVINPQRLMLNGGNAYKVEDSYVNLAVDFSTVSEGLSTLPAENHSRVNWAYHNNQGTFWVPDETAVTIKYKAKPIGEPGKSVTFSNALKMLSYEPEVVERTVTLNNETEGSAGDYNIRLFKYADNAMNLPLEGAVFQLFEESPTGEKVPAVFETTIDASTPDNPIPRYSSATFNDYNLLTSMLPQAPTNMDGTTAATYPTREVHREGDYIYFCTTRAGYADIHLNQSLDGLALERGKQYYLREVVTPAGYFKEDVDWSFIIDDMDYFDPENGIYVYRDNGELTVSNTSDESGLVLRKDFFGDVPDWDARRAIAFDIEVRDVTASDDGPVVLRKALVYSDYVQDHGEDATASGYRFKLRPEELNVQLGRQYRVTITERDAALATHDCATTVETQLGDNARSGKLSGNTASVDIDGAEVLNTGEPIRFWFENTYTARPVRLTVQKEWGTKAQAKFDKTVTFQLLREGALPGETAKAQFPVSLYWDAAENVYKPYDASIAGAVGQDSFTLNGVETTPWRADLSGLPRYDWRGDAYVYSIKEIAVTYRDIAGGEEKVAVGDDIDIRFTTSANDPDQQNRPATMRSTTEAQFDVDHRLSGSLTITNEIATLIDVTVQKTWPEGEDHEGEAVTYDLYRTTGELPLGGADRPEYGITTYNDNGSRVNNRNADISALGPFAVRNGDRIEITLRNDNISHTSNGVNYYWYNFSGLGFRPKSGTVIDTGGESAYWYAFDVESFSPMVDGLQLKVSNFANKGVSSSKAVPVDTIKVIVIAQYLEEMTTAVTNEYYGKLGFRDYGGGYEIMELHNLTAESENLTHEKLQALVDDGSAVLMRRNMTLEQLQGWTDSRQYPRDDGNGHNYTYFVLEHSIAGYEDTYEVAIPDEDARAHTITINNRVPDPSGDGQTTRLTLNKAVAFDPPASAVDVTGRTYYVSLNSGSRYVVQTGANQYELLSPKQINAHNADHPDALWSPYHAITVDGNGSGTLTITGIPEGSYTLTEIDDATHDADIDGFTLQTSYSSQTVNLTTGNAPARTITNTYAPILPPSAAFTFNKLWNSESDRQPVEWPTDQSISLSFYRETAAGQDEQFKVTFDVRLTYNAADNEKQWVIARVPAADDVNSDEALFFTPVLQATGDPGRFYRYAFTLTGIRETDEQNRPFTYYVRENLPDNAEYARAYGVVLGTAASAVQGMDEARAGQAIINTFEQAELTFIKQWYGQNRESILTEWPEREVEVDPESDAGAVPRDEPETEPVPMGIRIGRRLVLGTDAQGREILSKDLDVTFEAGFRNLTGESAHLESHPAEGKLTLDMVNDNGAFTYIIRGLKKSGTMLIDGEVRSGPWKYFVFEDYVYGYQTSYYENTADADAPEWRILDGEPAAPNGGRIVNTQQLGTLLINKNVVMPANTHLGEKTYAFVVRRKKAAGGKGQDRYLLPDGTLTTDYTAHTVTVTDAQLRGNWLYFYDVIPGDYEIEELGTEADGDAQLPGYALTVSPVTVTVGDDMQERVLTLQNKTLEGNNKVPVEFTNTYEIIKTQKAFQKAWLSGEGTTPIEWPDGETITIELRRYTTDPTTGSEIQDENFLLVYNGQKRGDEIVWTAVRGDSRSLETDEDQVILTEVESGYVYSIIFDRLTKYVLTGESAGQEWVYTITERPQARTDYAVHYGQIQGDAAIVRPEDTFAHGNDISGDTIDTAYDSAVINRRDYTHAQITKVWQDQSGNTIPWPKDGGGADIPIVITATGTQSGAADAVQRYALTSAEPSEDALYSYEVNENRYTFTLYRLDPARDYTFAEADVMEYQKSYENLDGSAAVEGIASNGTITNRRNPSDTTSVRFTKVWEDGARFEGNSNFRLYKAVTVTDPTKIQINIQPRAFDSNGNRVASGGSSVKWSYLYLYDEAGTQLARRGFQVTFAANVNEDIWIDDKVISGKEVRYVRFQVPDLNSANFVERGTIWLPSETGYYEIDRVLNIPLNLTVTAAAARWPASNGNYWFYPKDNYDGLPENAVPTRYSYGKWNAGDNFSPGVANQGWAYWDNAAGKNVYTMELPAYENGYPVSYYVVEESVTTEREAYRDRLVQEGVTAVYQRETGTNDWIIENKKTYTDTSFKKQWLSAEGAAMAWPKDAADRELPITAQVSRRLRYTVGAAEYTTADQDASAFSLTYSVTPSGGTLTKVNGRDATDGERAQFPLTSDAGGTYAFNIAGLESMGALGSRTGQWDYRVTELSAPEGFAEPEYRDAAGNRLPGGTQVEKDGSIVNRQLPVTKKVAVSKSFVNGAGHWPQDGFAFTLALKSGEAAHVALPAETTARVNEQTPNLESAFDAITFTAAGTYTFAIREAMPDPDAPGTVRNHIDYDSAEHTATIEVTEIDGRLVAGEPVYDGDQLALTVENTYRGPVSFGFSKVWLKADAALPTTDFEPWPEGGSIAVTLKRRTAAGEDDSFALIYRINASGATLDANSVGMASGTDYSLIVGDGADHWYAYETPEALDRVDAVGREYTYYIVETEWPTDFEKGVGMLDINDRVTAVSGDEAADGGVLVNRDTRIAIQVTKRWRDAQGKLETAWPGEKALSLTVTGECDGEAPVTYAFDPVGLGGTAQASGATLAVSDAYPFTVTIENLPHKTGDKVWTYRVTEAQTPGYEPATYENEPPYDARFDAAYDGGAMVNRKSPAILPEGSIQVTKALTGEGADDGKWPTEGFTFTLTYVGFDDSTVSYTYAEHGYSDAAHRPLLELPATVTATATPSEKTAGFGAVKFYRPGVYTFNITENLPPDAVRGVAHDIRYDGASYPVTIAVEDVGGTLTARAPVYPDSATFTNAYLTQTDFAFSKVWRSEDGDAIRWPGGTIAVTLERYVNDIKDETFELTYTIGGNDTAILPEGGSADFLLTRESADGNVYRYTLGEVLPRRNGAGAAYEYRVREAALPGYATTYLSRKGVSRTGDADDEGQIVNTSTGALPTGSLTVSKAVEGNMADANHAFTFTLTLSEPGSYSITGDGQPAGATIASGGTFTLSHGQSVIIDGLPVGCQVTLSEAQGDYTASHRVGGGSVVSGNVAQLTLDGDATVAFTNALNTSIDTGISTDTAPYVTLLLLLGAAVWLAQRRRWGGDGDG